MTTTRSIRGVLFALLFTLLLQGADKGPTWEVGKVLRQDYRSEASGTYSTAVGAGVAAIPVYRTFNRVTVETDAYVYQWAEIGRGAVILAVNGQVRFYREKDLFVVLDSKKKKHKFALVGMQAKQQ